MHEKKAFSVVPKVSPWCPNHMTVCLLRHSGESLQNGQLELWRRNWYFAWETHKDTAYQFEPVRQDFERVPEHRVSFEANPMRYSMGFMKSHSLKCLLHKLAWCITARKSARLNCINLIHCMIVAGELCKLARVMGPEFPHPFSPVGHCLPATGRCRMVRYKRQCLPGFCTMCWKVLVNPYPSSLHAEKCVILPLVRGLGAEKC